jgi:hypothetical protein
VRLTAGLAAALAAVLALSACGGDSSKTATTATTKDEPVVTYKEVRAVFETWHKTLLAYRAKRATPAEIDRETDAAFRVAEGFDDWRASKECALAVRAYSFMAGAYRERLLRGELNDSLATTTIEAGKFMEKQCD